MGGTINSIGLAPSLPTSVIGASSVGGDTSSISSLNGAALPTTPTPGALAGAPVAGAPVTGGGLVPAGATSAPATDLATAIANLQAAIGQLSAALAARQGAGQLGTTGPVTGGGAPAPTQSSGCGCGGGSPTQSPEQAPSKTGTPPGTPDQTPSEDKKSDDKLPEAPPLPGTTPGQDAGGGVRDKIVAAAKAELAKGVKEDAGEDNDKAGNIKRYRSAVTGAGEDPNAAEPWCADFASYIWKTAGVPFGPDGKGEDYTVAMVSKAKAAGTWTDRSKATPKPGDLVLFDWDRGTAVDHVAVVTAVDADGTVHTIGGNESDKVGENKYAKGDTRMVGFITPKGG